MSRTYTAEFPLVKYAKTFEARLREPGWWAVNIVRTGRTVTWESAVPADATLYTDEATYFQDMLGTVGYYGSTQNRKAKLNGIPCPVSY